MSTLSRDITIDDELFGPTEMEELLWAAFRDRTSPEDCKGLKSLEVIDPSQYLTDTGRPTPIVKNERIPTDVPDTELYDSRSSAAIAAQRANQRSTQQVRASDEEGFWKATQD